MIRDEIKAATIVAMKARDTARLNALRLMSAAIKNKDIEARTAPAGGDDDAGVADVLRRMIKQRRDSIAMYLDGGRPELAAAEAAEIAVIEGFLPAQMDEGAARAAIAAVAAEIGASGPKDMGRLMAEVKARFAGVMDMSGASGHAKAVLAG